MKPHFSLILYLAANMLCASVVRAETAASTSAAIQPYVPDARRYLSQPLVTDLFTADPAAHVFEGRIYVYVSHDIADGPPLEDVEPFKGSEGNAFKMRDYRVLSMEKIGGAVTVSPVALDIANVPWAARQMWAPDAAYKNGTYFLYFPAKDRSGAFRIGVATAKSPIGPFSARPEPIRGSFSIDPAVFTDDDGQTYMYFGGRSGGQLEQNTTGRYLPNPSPADEPSDATALMPKVAKLRDDMLEFAESPRDAMIVDSKGLPIKGGDRRFFEASWMHKYKGKYYFSYSTGGTHFIAYAIGDSPYGPFTYRGKILLPVQGWTTHESIVQFEGRWWLFYADSQLSDKTWLRNVKVTELFYNPDGTIQLIDPFLGNAQSLKAAYEAEALRFRLKCLPSR